MWVGDQRHVQKVFMNEFLTLNGGQTLLIIIDELLEQHSFHVYICIFHDTRNKNSRAISPSL